MNRDKYNIRGKITKATEDQQLVFGWASVVSTADGELVEDFEGNILDEFELERVVYAYVLNSREAGTDHEVIGVGKIVESIVFTKEKQKLLGIPEGILPVAWFVGFKVDADVFEKVKSGEFAAFSIGGSALREAV